MSIKSVWLGLNFEEAPLNNAKKSYTAAIYALGPGAGPSFSLPGARFTAMGSASPPISSTLVTLTANMTAGGANLSGLWSNRADDRRGPAVCRRVARQLPWRERYIAVRR
jgi:hypothetical protein